MSSKLNILILGASYGLLLATKLVFAGHNVKLVCRPEEAKPLNVDGALVRIPVRSVDSHVELSSRDATGSLAAAIPDNINPSDFDLICLAMQEPQYRVPELRKLLGIIAKSQVPCMSIMNMPPIPYLKRIAVLDTKLLEHCYTDADVWSDFDPELMTLASPDPQAFRPPEQPQNVLHVGLPTNFKVARFSSNTHTAILKQIEADIDAIRYNFDGREIHLPVKLRVHDSLYVPLAKWSMLLTGNYRCVQEEHMRPISEAVHQDIELSRSVYEWVAAVCMKIGASPDDLVPFDKYAIAAKELLKPSSAARALAAGATNIERVDTLVKSIAELHGLQNDMVDETCDQVEAWLTKNRMVHQRNSDWAA